MSSLIDTQDINFIKTKIHNIRGKQVMLDSDLAFLYKCKNGTKSVNLAVNRNINRFPERFRFQLTKEEYQNVLKFQNETSKEIKRGGIRKLPYVYTEQGVAMLASVIHTPVAEEISVAIMDAFVAMRKYIEDNQLYIERFESIYYKQLDTDKKLAVHEEKIKELFNKFSKKKLVNQIYFNGRVYDAYSKIVDIFRLAKEELIIIDGYADKTILDMITDIKCKVVLITKKNNLLKEIDIQKYKKQYNNLSIKYDNTYHDRYFIIDKREVYHCGTSINYAGNKTFSINILEDEIVKKELINHAQI